MSASMVQTIQLIRTERMQSGSGGRLDVNSAFNRLVLAALTSILESPVFERAEKASMFLKRAVTSAVSQPQGDLSDRAMANYLYNGLAGEAPVNATSALAYRTRDLYLPRYYWETDWRDEVHIDFPINVHTKLPTYFPHFTYAFGRTVCHAYEQRHGGAVLLPALQHPLDPSIGHRSDSIFARAWFLELHNRLRLLIIPKDRKIGLDNALLDELVHFPSSDRLFNTDIRLCRRYEHCRILVSGRGYLALRGSQPVVPVVGQHHYLLWLCAQHIFRHAPSDNATHIEDLFYRVLPDAITDIHCEPLGDNNRLDHVFLVENRPLIRSDVDYEALPRELASSLPALRRLDHRAKDQAVEELQKRFRGRTYTIGLHDLLFYIRRKSTPEETPPTPPEASSPSPGECTASVRGVVVKARTIPELIELLKTYL